MKRGKELKTRYFAENSRFAFLAEEEKYLFSDTTPQYRLNVIGTGTIGQEHMYVTMLEGRALIHGIYDPRAASVENAQREFKKYSNHTLQVYDSLEQACNAEEVDGLIICTPNHTHLDVVKTAAKSGKHILLEKPMATTIADAQEITQIAEKYQGVFQIGLQYRYKSIYVEAIHEALNRKAIGDIKTISMMEHRPPFLDKAEQWNKFSKYSGGTLVEKCCHYFDLINLFSRSRPATVFATGSAAVNFREFEYKQKPADIIDNAAVIITCENGVNASFSLNMFCPNFYEELVLCGDAGRLKASEEFDFFHGDELRCLLEIQHGENRPARTIVPRYATLIENSGHHGATFYEHQVFVDNIEGKQTDSANVSQGFWAVIVAVAAEESIKRNALINIQELLAESAVSLG